MYNNPHLNVDLMGREYIEVGWVGTGLFTITATALVQVQVVLHPTSYRIEACLKTARRSLLAVVGSGRVITQKNKKKSKQTIANGRA